MSPDLSDERDGIRGSGIPFSHIVPLSVPPRIYIGLSIESLYENSIICKKYSIIYVEYGNNACYDKDI